MRSAAWATNWTVLVTRLDDPDSCYAGLVGQGFRRYRPFSEPGDEIFFLHTRTYRRDQLLSVAHCVSSSSSEHRGDPAEGSVVAGIEGRIFDCVPKLRDEFGSGMYRREELDHLSAAAEY